MKQLAAKYSFVIPLIVMLSDSRVGRGLDPMVIHVFFFFPIVVGYMVLVVFPLFFNIMLLYKIKK